MVDITQNTYGERIVKSPPFAKEIKITFSDDVSVETMRKFRDGNEWLEPFIKEVIIDWNLQCGDAKLPICIESLDKINSIKLRNWIIKEVQSVLLDSLDISKKKS
jgi:hypothetical protein